MHLLDVSLVLSIQFVVAFLHFLRNLHLLLLVCQHPLFGLVDLFKLGLTLKPELIVIPLSQRIVIAKQNLLTLAEQIHLLLVLLL